MGPMSITLMGPMSITLMGPMSITLMDPMSITLMGPMAITLMGPMSCQMMFMNRSDKFGYDCTIPITKYCTVLYTQYTLLEIAEPVSQVIGLYYLKPLVLYSTPLGSSFLIYSIF